jgi:hypothetical protein
VIHIHAFSYLLNPRTCLSHFQRTLSIRSQALRTKNCLTYLDTAIAQLPDCGLSNDESAEEIEGFIRGFLVGSACIPSIVMN